MGALRLAWSLIIIPRLFFALIFFPLLLSLLLVYVQLVFTGAAFRVVNRDAGEIKSSLVAAKRYNIVRWFVYGDGYERKEMRECRWVLEDPNDPAWEVPPSPECEPDRLDLAIHVKDPATFDASRYKKQFSGQIDRIHICRSCSPDLVVKHDENNRKLETRATSVWGVGVMSLGMINEEFGEKVVEMRRSFDDLKGLFGTRLYEPVGFRHPLDITKLHNSTLVLLNFSLIVIVTLWLAIKAHRRVLDYFVRNGALLPMVAACSKRTFYGALWILTGTRVGAFLVAAVPLSMIAFIEFVGRKELEFFFHGDTTAIIWWIVALVISISLSTMIASIAELRQRHEILSFLYKYFPILLSLIGGLLWTATFLVDGETSSLIRHVLTITPILGMVPVLVAPLFCPPIYILALHSILSGLMLMKALNHNARWFAAHLEEL